MKRVASLILVASALCLAQSASVRSPTVGSKSADGEAQGDPHKAVNVRDFGAKCDGTDAAPGIRAAIATGSDVYIASCLATEPNNYYLVGSFGGSFEDNSWIFILDKSNQKVYSEGSATVKMGKGLVNSGNQMWGGGMFLLRRTYGITFSSFTIDMNGAENLVPTGRIRNAIAIKGVSSSHIELERIVFLNPSGENDVVFDLSSSYISGHDLSVIGSGQCLSGNTNQVDWTALYSEASNTDFSNNKIQNCPSTGSYLSYPQGPAGGIELHNSHSTAIGNDIDHAYPCAYVSGDGAAIPSTGSVYRGNHCHHAYAGIVFNNWVIDNATIEGNDIQLTPGEWPAAAGSRGPSVGIQEIYWTQPASNYTILNNTVIAGNTVREEEANTPSSPLATGITLAAMHGSSVTGNTIENLSGSGIVVYGSGYGLTQSKISQNRLVNWGQNSGPYGHQGIILAFDGTNEGCAVPCTRFKNLTGLTISDNTLQMDVPTKIASIGFYLSWDTRNSLIAGLDIHGNRFLNTEPLGGPSAKAYNATISGYNPLQWLGK